MVIIIAPSNNLDAHFMEINKGPDIEGKDERDTKLKYNMLKGVFELIDTNKCDDNTLNKLFFKTNFERIF